MKKIWISISETKHAFNVGYYWKANIFHSISIQKLLSFTFVQILNFERQLSIEAHFDWCGLQSIGPFLCRAFDDVFPAVPCHHVCVRLALKGKTHEYLGFSDRFVSEVLLVVSIESCADYVVKMVKPRFKGNSSINPSTSSSNPGELKLD